MNKIEKLLLELLHINSVTGNEKKLADFVVGKLQGFEIEKQVVAGERYNVIARKGSSKTWIVVHLDTVPGDIPVRITKDKIYGRGACDNKGNLAGAILVGNKLEDINLLFTVGEEVDFAGAKKAKIEGEKIIVMEPTEFKIMNGQLGVLAFSLKTNGVEKHTSQPFGLEESAIHKIIKSIDYLLEKNFNAFNVGIISGGTADNVVSGEARCEIMIRPKNEKEFNVALDAIDFIKKEFNCEVKMIDEILPHSSSFAIAGEVAPFASEMSFFKNGLLFGAGNIQQAHTNDEFILRKDLSKLERELEKIIVAK